MLEAALRSGAASRRCVFEVFARRLPDGRRYGVVAGTGRLLDAIEPFRFGDDELEQLAVAGRRRGDARVPRGLPLRRRHLGVCRGRVLLPRLAGARGRVRLRARSGARDPRPVHPQPRQRHRVRRLADDLGRGRPTLHRDGVAPHPRGGRGRRRPRGIHRGFRDDVEPGGRAPVRGADGRARRRTRSPCCTTTSARRSPPRSPRSGRGTTLLVDTYDVTTAVALAVELAGPELGGGPARLGRPARPGPRGARPARPPRRDGHPDHRDQPTSTSTPSPPWLPDRSTATAWGPRW